MSSLRFREGRADETTGGRVPPSLNQRPLSQEPAGIQGRPQANCAARIPESDSLGLYDPQYEHDACGVGLVADLTGKRGHAPVEQALTVLANLEHRGAKGADPQTGDGAGILTQIPDDFFRAVCDFELPAPGHYAAGLVFLPSGRDLTGAFVAIEAIAEAEGLVIIGRRDVPHDSSACGTGARAILPHILQFFVQSASGESGLALDRRAYCLPQRGEHEAR